MKYEEGKSDHLHADVAMKRQIDKTVENHGVAIKPYLTLPINT